MAACAPGLPTAVGETCAELNRLLRDGDPTGALTTGPTKTTVPGFAPRQPAAGW